MYQKARYNTCVPKGTQGDNQMQKYFKTHLITNFIKKNNWSKTRFCKECKIDLRVYEKIMAQKINFRANMLFRIARVMGIEAYQLCY